MFSLFKLLAILVNTIITSFITLILSLIDRSFNSYFFIAKAWGESILFISGIKLNISGLENFDRKGTYIFVSNHSSQFDIPAVQAAVPDRLSIVAKKELSKIPLFGWQLVTGPYIMIDRKNAENAMRSIEEAKKKMTEKKISALIFAEGTRSTTGEVQPFKRGAFYLATKTGLPIVPVTISGSHKILPKGKFKINKGTITVRFDKPVDTSYISSRKDEIELMNKVREIIISNHKGD
jgi:1-acyl-sn-glycerol-3-phosphate acyltransferase